jgi:hypothetical protein
VVLGAAALLGSRSLVAAQSSQTVVEVVVNSTISIASDASTGKVSMTVVPLIANDATGGTQGTGSETITINTNNTGGYTLKIEDNDANTALVSGASDTIDAGAGTFAASAALSASTNGQWGYRLDSFANNTFAGVPVSGSGDTLKNTSTVANNDATTVTYGVQVKTSQPAGTYNDTVVYTAITN